MVEIQHISAFLSRVEGTRQTRGYVPCNKLSGGTANYRGDVPPGNYKAMGASGVTIATGCDLGQTLAATLREYGLSEDIIKLYEPYFGKRQDAALQALWEMPLTVSDEAAALTDMAVHRGYLYKNVIPAYNKKSSVPFEKLPPNAQDVIMSVCFQKGCGGVARDWPKLWGYLTRRDWHGASQELLHGFRQYKQRRAIEGEHLAAMLR